METSLNALNWAGLVGSGLVAGTFFAFSAFVMRALGKLPAAEGISAMQSINIVVISPLFMAVFMGTVLISLAAAAGAIYRWDRPGAGYVIAAAVLYVVFTFGVTAAFNVPMNDALAKITPTDSAAAQYWAEYLSRWTLWNHLRGAASTGAMVMFAMALRA